MNIYINAHHKYLFTLSELIQKEKLSWTATEIYHWLC
jgi:hypothetical protein